MEEKDWSLLHETSLLERLEEGVGPSTEPPIGEKRPEEVETFFRLHEEADQYLWPGCKEFKKLEAVVRLYQIKCLVGMPDEIFTTLLELIKRMLPEGDCLPESCYKAKKLRSDLILGPRSPGKEIDVYMRPLIDELNELWEMGTPTYDAYSNQSFTMKAAVLWTISDFLAYGMLSGWSTHGYKACPHCMHDKESIYLPASRKICYMGHRHFLEDNHRFRRQTINFNGRREHRSAPRHNLDVMHIEKNICDSVVGTLLDIKKCKDGLAARADLEVLNIRRPNNKVGKKPKFVTTLIPFRNTLCHTIYTILQPFSATLEKKDLVVHSIDEGGPCAQATCILGSSKSSFFPCFSFNVSLESIESSLLLPLAILLVLPKAVTMLCSKKESEEGFKQLNSRIALTLCQLEKIFPHAFFDIMVHLPVHLADEASLARPVQYRWMYPIERYLQMLKRYVRNKGRPEGSIAEAYLVDECLSFCSMYLRDVGSRRTRRGRNEDGIGRGVSGGLSIFYSKGCYMGSGENVELDLNVLDQCHRYILNNCDEVNPFRRQHEEFLKMKHRQERLTMRQIQELSKKEFPKWFKQHMNSRCHPNDTLISQDLRWLANYPSRVVSRYKSHIVHGFRFRIKYVDDLLVLRPKDARICILELFEAKWSLE
ncbi:unnamed protein product [Malus baccata var. baccata]